LRVRFVRVDDSRPIEHRADVPVDVPIRAERQAFLVAADERSVVEIERSVAGDELPCSAAGAARERARRLKPLELARFERIRVGPRLAADGPCRADVPGLEARGRGAAV